MAEEPGKYPGSDIGKLHNAGNDERGQWDLIPGDRDEPGYERDEQCSNADGQRRPEHHDAAGESNGERRAGGDVYGGSDGSATAELSVAEEPGKYPGSDVGELHNAGNDERGQWDLIPGNRDEPGYERDEQCSNADGQRRPEHRDAAGESNGERRAGGDVYGGSDGSATAELSVAEEPGKYPGSDVGELHNAGNDERGQWDLIPGDRDEPGYERDEQCGNADGQRRPEHHDAASESSGERRTGGDVYGGSDGSATAELSVAEEPGKYPGSDIGKLHNAGNDERGQWNLIPGDRDEPGYERDEQCGNADGQRRPEHHDAAGESNGERRAGGDVYGGSDGSATAELSVAGEPGKYPGSDVGELHNAGNDERGQWDLIPGDRDEPGYERDEQCGNADGQRRPEHHDAAGESNGERRTGGDVYGGSDGSATAELSVAGEPGKYPGSDVGELHNAGNDERGQWDLIPGNRDEPGYERDEQCSNADREYLFAISQCTHAAQ